MLIKTIFSFLTENDLSTRYKITILFKFVKYYYNLQRGLRSGKIYHNIETQNSNVEFLIKNMDKFDYDLIDILFKKNVKDFLSKINILSDLDFTKKNGFSQIGYNNVYIEKPMSGLWTTGKATYYLPTKLGVTNRIVLEIFSIPPLKITIGFENEIVNVSKIPTLATKKIEVLLNPDKITKEISEIFIITDKLWFPDTITRMSESIPIGICVRAIHVFYS